MGKVTTPMTSADKVPGEGADLVIFKTLFDTTWRLFIPSIGLTVAGVIADKTFSTKPWLTVAGVAVGVALSITLVFLQMKGIRRP